MGTDITSSSIKDSSWLKAWTKKYRNTTHLYQAANYESSGYSALELLHLFPALPISNSKIDSFQGDENNLPERSVFYKFWVQKRCQRELLVFTLAQKVNMFLTTLISSR